uniref:Uncharacterized protein n=1 Tax=Setaria viridis TaxID=4556 RepID=A0A4U6UY81_SETVI|nr:hypothetical protein SEVIR_4G136901v2 [Setaria viridis]
MQSKCDYLVASNHYKNSRFRIKKEQKKRGKKTPHKLLPPHYYCKFQRPPTPPDPSTSSTRQVSPNTLQIPGRPGAGRSDRPRRPRRRGRAKAELVIRLPHPAAGRTEKKRAAVA